MLHAQPGLMRTVMIGICGVLLVLFVLRPVAQPGDGDAAGAAVVAGWDAGRAGAVGEPEEVQATGERWLRRRFCRGRRARFAVAAGDI